MSHDPTESTPPVVQNLSPLNRKPGDPPRRKVALIGFEEANGQTAPMNDPDWEVWGFNMGNRMGIHYDAQHRFRADRWFDLHPREPQSVLDMAWIDACPCPIYLPTKFTANPNAYAFPLEAIEQHFADSYDVPRGYWCSSFAYAVALALFEGAQTIGLFGINLNWGRERIVERANLEFWLGLAKGQGVTIVLSPKSKLLTHPARYGFEYEAERQAVIADCGETVRQLLQQAQFKAGIDKELQDRIDALRAVRDEAAARLWQLAYAGRRDLA